MNTFTKSDRSLDPVTSSRALETIHAIFDRILQRNQTREFAIRLWDDQTLPAVGTAKPQFTLILTHPGALRRMFLPPGEMSLAEAYLRGDFDIEGDMIAAMQLIPLFLELKPADWIFLARKVMALPDTDPPMSFAEGRQPARLRGFLHSRERDRDAVTYHYDVGNNFYALFLGDTMAYSTAYFETPTASLDQAQTAKFEHICRKLRLQPGERLLDIGCGWGGLVVYAAQKYGVNATGINLSKPQVDFARAWIEREGIADRATIKIIDYRDLDPVEPFDKVVSVGMFEHVGRAKLPEYFAAANRVLRPGGLFLNHGIAAQFDMSPGLVNRLVFKPGRFSQQYVFPDGELVPVSDALVIAEHHGFEVRDVESLREHYALTLRRWVHNLEGNHQEAVDLKGERTYRVWRLYMSAAAVGFDIGETNVFQSLLSKSRDTTAELPLTRADLYQM